MAYKLTSDQWKLGSEIIGNMSVAWFGTGVVAPLFVTNANPLRLVYTIFAGLLMSVVFFSLALFLVRKSARRRR